jgi:hypothetical protein
MQYLETVSREERASWYRLCGDYQGAVHRWLSSTPETIAICNEPQVCGVDYTRRMRDAMVSALTTAPFRPFLESVPSSRLCIMNFLRGGLNFDLRGALSDALGSNFHATCFMSSQRKRKDGRWTVKEDMYRKMKVPHGAILLVGDVVATGVTVENGFRVIEQYLVETETPISGVVFFTIGCHKLEKILEEVHRRFSKRFPDHYRETHAIYLEGKFKLVDSATRLMIAIQGTDLVKVGGAVMTPEFEASQYDTLFAPLERCTIYDAGSRAFDVGEYFSDVLQYWEQLHRLARRGYTLKEALKERWPESGYGDRESFLAAKNEVWKGLDGAFLEALHDRYQGRWSTKFKRWAGTREALQSVCEERLSILGGMLAKAEGRDE